MVEVCKKQTNSVQFKRFSEYGFSQDCIFCVVAHDELPVLQYGRDEQRVTVQKRPPLRVLYLMVSLN